MSIAGRCCLTDLNIEDYMAECKAEPCGHCGCYQDIDWDKPGCQWCEIITDLQKCEEARVEEREQLRVTLLQVKDLGRLMAPFDSVDLALKAQEGIGEWAKKCMRRAEAAELQNDQLRARVKELEEAPLNLPGAVEAKKAVLQNAELQKALREVILEHDSGHSPCSCLSIHDVLIASLPDKRISAAGLCKCGDPECRRYRDHE